MKKLKKHRSLGIPNPEALAACGNWYTEDRVTKEWRKVTCGNCLRRRKKQ